jgi:haloalkane dehalogenase
LEQTVFDVLQRAANSLEILSGALQVLASRSGDCSVGSSSAEAPEAARSGPAGVEEVIIRYTVGEGRFDAEGKYIVLKSKMYKMNGEEDGHHEGVFESLNPDPAALLKWFTPPSEPLDAPNPVEHDTNHIEIRAYTKAIWTFQDGSAIISTGPAVVHLARFKDGPGMFFVSVAGSITNGTGRYKGALGIKNALGGTFLRPDAAFGPGAAFPGKTVETFRVIRKQDLILPPKETPSSAFPYASHYQMVRGSRMHYIEEGVGDPILFLHGNPVWSYMWRNVIPFVKDSGRCIAVDMIGMGKSDKPNIDYGFADQAEYLEEFIAALGLNRITLVMNDWGVILGFDYAMRHPDKVRGLAFSEAMMTPYESWDAFLTPGGPPQFRETFQQFREGPEGTGLGWDLLVRKNLQVLQLLPAVFGRPMTEAERRAYLAPFPDEASRKVIWKFANDLPVAGEPRESYARAKEYAKRLKESKIPKLLLAGWPGVITAPYHVEWARRNLTNLKIVQLGWSLHMPPETDPERYGRAIAEWLESI